MRELLAKLAGKHVVVVGDVMLDEFVRGDVKRISPEAPVPVMEVTSRELRLGGAANAAANVVALGGRATVIGLVGEDASAPTVERLLAERGLEAALVRDASRPTTHKTRFVARGQQIVRIDQEVRSAPSGGIRAKLVDAVRNAVARADACVLSDYAKGTIVPDVVKALIEGAKARSAAVVVDPKRSDFAVYRGATVLTPNSGELEAAVHRELHTDEEFARAAAELLPLLDGGALLATRGADGMMLFQPGKKPVHEKAKAKSVFDVTGAGDTVVATLAIALAAKASLTEAMTLASGAAGIVVSKVGTATVSPAEIEAALEHD
jgi:D-beta-D-heptose 7-phosphate kinase/D-beta-D-heptose 1-phosphate adenosyltransferase